jgi:hypothetical protein
MAVRNLTKWTPLSGQGYVVNIGNILFATNTGVLLVTNSNSNLVTTPTLVKPKHPTLWTTSGA